MPPARLEKIYSVVRWSDMPKGGHFAASEEPELMWRTFEPSSQRSRRAVAKLQLTIFKARRVSMYPTKDRNLCPVRLSAESKLPLQQFPRFVAWRGT